MIHTKTYLSPFFYYQYLVLLTMVPLNGGRNLEGLAMTNYISDGKKRMRVVCSQTRGSRQHHQGHGGTFEPKIVAGEERIRSSRHNLRNLYGGKKHGSIKRCATCMAHGMHA